MFQALEYHEEMDPNHKHVSKKNDMNSSVNPIYTKKLGNRVDSILKSTFSN